MSDLEEIERQAAHEIARFAAINPSYSLRRTLLAAFLVTPFALINFMFIPIFGQAIVLASGALSLYYFRIKRSWSLLGIAVMGVALALSLLLFVVHFLFQLTGMLLFILLGLSTAVMLGFIWLLYGAIWWHFNDAHQRLTIAKSSF